MKVSGPYEKQLKFVDAVNEYEVTLCWLKNEDLVKLEEMKVSTLKTFLKKFSKCEQSHSYLWICTHLHWTFLPLSWRRSLSYRNQSIDLQSKSMDWFLHDIDHRHERVKGKLRFLVQLEKKLLLLTTTHIHSMNPY